MQKFQPGKVAVETPYGVEIVNERRARWLALATNAEVVKTRAGQIVRVIMRSHTVEDARPGRAGNPQKHIHHAETDTNPPRVWAYKGIFGRGSMGTT